MLCFEGRELSRLELIVNNAVAFPEQHVCARLVGDVAAQVPVGCKENALTALMEFVHDGQGAATRHHPVCTSLHRRTGVGIDHHGVVGVVITKAGEVIHGAAQVERTGCLKVGHEHCFFW